jgi:predicted PurR-regulated permease PerM
MNKSIKVILIFLIAFLILIVIIAGILGYLAYKQINGLRGYTNDKTIKSYFEQLMQGNCSIYPRVESKIGEIEKKLSSACANPIAKVLIKKYSNNDVCLELNSDSDLKHNMERIKELCSKQNIQ